MVRNASCQGGTVVTPNFGVGSYDCVKAQYGHLHGNITAFWYEYWKPLYYAQAYPFTGYADIDDFEPVFETLIKVCVGKIPSRYVFFRSISDSMCRKISPLAMMIDGPRSGSPHSRISSRKQMR